MKKHLLIIFLSIFLFVPLVEAKTIQGGVVYTVETARREAFRGILYKIDIENYKDLLVDPGFISAGNGKKRPKISKKDRFISFFSNGGYCVQYYDDWNRIYSYDSSGMLEFIEFREFRKFPGISKDYDTKGNLLLVIFWISRDECYEYDPKGNLISYWKGKYNYDVHGKIFAERY